MHNNLNFPAVQAFTLMSAMSCTEAQGGSFKHYLQPSGGHNSETMLQKAYVHITFFSHIVMQIHLLLSSAVHFSFTQYTPQIKKELMHMKFCSTIYGTP